MGFGYLLIGYFLAFAFSLANVYFFFDLIGGAVMLLGLSKLAPHGKNFYRAMWVDIVFLALSLLRVVAVFLQWTTQESILYKALGIGIAAVSLVLQFFILAGIYFIAQEVELQKEENAARRNIFLILLYYFSYIIAVLLVPYLGVIGNFVYLAVTVLGIVAFVLNLILLHSCYCRICLKGQESGERPPSRYAWVNRFHEKTDAMFDRAYLRPEKTRKTPSKTADTTEPGYRRVKRKKKSGRK